MYNYLSIYLSIHPSIYLSIYLSIYTYIYHKMQRLLSGHEVTAPNLIRRLQLLK